MSDLLPPNATPQERALSETTARIGDVPVPIRDLWDPETCPVELLPWLAWAFSVDDWDPLWTEVQQRQAVKASYQIHRHKGTISAVKDAMSALGYDAEVIEWFNQTPAGDPYTFDLKLGVDQNGIVLADVNRLLAVIESSKNLRSHLGTIDITVKSSAQVYTATVATVGSLIEFSAPAGALLLDGTWTLDGAENLDGLKNYFGAA